MQITYSVALWNYGHYRRVPSLERLLAQLREREYGVEIRESFRDERDLLDQVGRERLRPALQGMTVGLHSAGGNTWGMHQKQIDAAADIGASVIVLHTANLLSKERVALETQQRVLGVYWLETDQSRKPSDFDLDLARQAVAYAAERGVTLALENGIDTPPFSLLTSAVENVQGLAICLDVGHLYRPWDPAPTPDPMREFLDALREHIVHLHIDDAFPDTELDDHFAPGTGGIPVADWRLLASALQEVDYRGMAVFEVRPRTPLETAALSKAFMQEYLEDLAS